MWAVFCVYSAYDSIPIGDEDEIECDEDREPYEDSENVKDIQELCISNSDEEIQIF